jgi:hypothetical protein
MRVKMVVPSLLFALFAPFALHSSPSRVPVILVLLPATMETPYLRAVIVDAITVELEVHDATVVSSDEAPAGSNEVFSIAERNKADFVILGTYTFVERRVELGLTWYDVAEREAFPEVRTSGPLDLSFDSIVYHAVDKLLDGHEQRLASLPPIPAQKASPAAPATPSAAAPRETLSVRPTKASQLSFSVGSAPFIPVFKASAYISTVGLSFTAKGEYLLPLGGGWLGIVGVSGIHFFHAEKASVADAFVVPIGAGIVYRTLTGSPIDFAVEAEAGPSIFVLTPAGGESSVGVVPFLSSGVGLIVNFSAHFGASVQIDYVAILVPDAIMGFVPSIGFDIRP